MAEFKIIQSQAKVKDSATPPSTSLMLPLSLASTVGSGFQAVAKSISDIQKDVIALENQNTVNRILPDINLEAQKVYERYSNSTDTKDTDKFRSDIAINKFEKFYKNENNIVKRLLASKVSEKEAELTPKLFSKIVSNNVNQLGTNISDAFDQAISLIVSSDIADKAVGSKTFDSLANNNVYKNFLGQETWEKIVKSKIKLRNKILLNSELKLNPRSVISNKDELEKAVGPVETNKITERAKENILSDRAKKKEVDRYQLLLNQETRIETFAEILLRINNSKRNPTDQELFNEIPTIQELHELYDLEFINEAMFVKLSDYLAQPYRLDGQSTAFTEPEIFSIITEQFLAADTIDLLNDVQSVILDGDDLDKIAFDDINLFSSYINSAKGDLTKHRDYKTFLTTLKGNIAKIERGNSRTVQMITKNIADFENNIVRAYTRKVVDGMEPEMAYLSTLNENMPKQLMPNLNSLPPFTKMANISDAIGNNPEKFFDDQYNLILERYKKSRKGQYDMADMLQKLDQLDFAKDIFFIRLNLYNGSVKDAAEMGPGLFSNNNKKISLDP
tara:strand:+ start:561 stop:2246 length:1686 start_codon:yes stop_codon:yes gene_type:complete